MSDFEYIMNLVVLALFSIYLYSRHRQRMLSRPRQPWEPLPPREDDTEEQIGEAIDVTKLKPTVESVRHDYVAARQRARGGFLRKRLLGLARRSVARLSFFHGRELEEVTRGK
jgi:hypothetical protein